MLWLGEKKFQNKGNAVRLTDKLLSEINDAVDSIIIPVTLSGSWYEPSVESSWATTAETIEAHSYTQFSGRQYITANSSTEGTYEATGI